MTAVEKNASLTCIADANMFSSLCESVAKFTM